MIKLKSIFAWVFIAAVLFAYAHRAERKKTMKWEQRVEQLREYDESSVLFRRELRKSLAQFKPPMQSVPENWQIFYASQVEKSEARRAARQIRNQPTESVPQRMFKRLMRVRALRSTLVWISETTSMDQTEDYGVGNE